MDDAVEAARRVAWATRAHAHVPYSKFRVGAALKLRGTEEAIGGCNVENASFGATVCAERTAMLQAVSRFALIKPEFIVVVTEASEPTVPCALCLQVLAEFCDDEFKVHLGDGQKILASYTLRELLPKPFRSFEVDRK